MRVAAAITAPRRGDGAGAGLRGSSGSPWWRWIPSAVSTVSGPGWSSTGSSWIATGSSDSCAAAEEWAAASACSARRPRRARRSIAIATPTSRMPNRVSSSCSGISTDRREPTTAPTTETPANTSPFFHSTLP